MSNNIVLATDSDREQLMTLYKEQVGREFCAWDEDYPSTETIDFDLSRDALFVMKANDAIIRWQGRDHRCAGLRAGSPAGGQRADQGKGPG